LEYKESVETMKPLHDLTVWQTVKEVEMLTVGEDWDDVFIEAIRGAQVWAWILF
jgi:hypothetical protein